MLRLTLAAALLALPVAATAQEKAAGVGQPPQRVRSVLLAPGQKCPPSTANDVVVCGNLGSPYRIPKELRNDGPIPVPAQAWSNRAAIADQIGRTAGGLPDTCSPVGSGGMTGCSQQASRDWVAEKTAERRAASSVP